MNALTLRQVPTLLFGVGAFEYARTYLRARGILRSE
jgi:hypothetical protein